MRSIVKVVALMLMLLALLIPLTSYASGGKCPDDPVLSAECVEDAPPFYVVLNRDFEALDRPGTGCQPIILNFPECETCCGEEQDQACRDATTYMQANVCPELADKVDWTETDSAILYQMCCDCGSADGTWMYRVRLLREDGSCDIDPQNEGCYEGLPPGTGIDLPAPLLVGGLAVVGTVMLAGGLVIRRRTVLSS